MSTILMTGILFAFAGCGAMMMRRRFEEQLPLAVGLVVSVLYAFALFNQLRAGAVAVLALSAAALIGQAVCLIKNRAQKPWKLIATPGCMAFFLIALWLLISYRGYMFTEWDDFSHWGLAVKNMSVFSALPSAVPEATITYTDYPPASTLFAWFWTLLSGGFNEGDAQRALNMMMLCFLLPAMKEQEWKHPFRALCVSTLLFILPLVFDDTIYRGLQVDGLLGCMMLYALYAWFCCEHDRSTWCRIGITMFLLPLVKEMGMFFAAVTVLLIMADILRANGWKLATGWWRVPTSLVLMLAVGKFSWSSYLRLHQVGAVWDKSSIDLMKMVRFLLGKAHPDFYEITGRFFECLFAEAWWQQGSIITMSYLMWILVCVIAQRWIAAQAESEKSRCLQFFRLMMAGLAIYLVAMLMMYLFMLRLDEARKMLSIERYLSSYMIPVLGMTLLLALKCCDHPQRREYVNLPLFLLAAVLLTVNPMTFYRQTVQAYDLNRTGYETRMNELLPSDTISQLNSQTDRVYIVASGDNGYQYYLDAYQLTPVHIQDGMWTTWPVAEKTDFWLEGPAIEYSVQAWGQVLADGAFTHVYLDTIDERFINDYSSLFDGPDAIRSAELYQVETYGEGVKLVAVQ